MKGNPYAGRSFRTSPDAGSVATALWGLAFEQRTANLIALHAIDATDLTGWPEASANQWLALGADIEARLGLRGGGE